MMFQLLYCNKLLLPQWRLFELEFKFVRKITALFHIGSLWNFVRWMIDRKRRIHFHHDIISDSDICFSTTYSVFPFLSYATYFFQNINSNIANIGSTVVQTSQNIALSVGSVLSLKRWMAAPQSSQDSSTEHIDDHDDGAGVCEKFYPSARRDIVVIFRIWMFPIYSYFLSNSIP